MKKICFMFLITLFVASMILGSCSTNTVTSSVTTTATKSVTSTEKTSVTTTATTSVTKTATTSVTATVTASPTSAVEGEYGGILRIVSTEPFYNIGDPRQSGNPTDACYRHLFTETLLRFSWHEENRGEIVPWLAKTWEYNDALTTLTLTLQEGVKYHDGTDFNAQSVKETFEAYIEAGLQQLNSVASFEVLDTYTLRMNLSRFDVSLIGLLAQSPIGQMISPTAMNTYEKDKMIGTPVGTGPFKLVSYAPGEKIVSERNNDYWIDGLPYLDGIEITFIAESTVAKMAFERGEFDVCPRMDVKEGSELIATGKYNVFISPAGFEFMLGGDVSNPDSMFADINVRKAIAYSVNVEKIVKQLGYGLWQQNRRSWNPAHWANDPSPSPYYYDPNKASELLAASGYPGGFSTTIYMRDATYTDAITVMQSNLRDIGINADIKIMTSAEAAEQATKGWQKSIRHLLGPTSAEREPSITALTYYTTGNPYNASMMLTPDVIALYEQASGEADMAKRKALVQEADRLTMDEYCLLWNFVMVPFVVPKQLNVRGDNLRHFVGHYWTPEQAWLSK